ncbi:MAG: phasin family protein [Gammaproteobacteria bacterium]|nr:phasin family protein [Gammaproteobacteria bacterium]
MASKKVGSGSSPFEDLIKKLEQFDVTTVDLNNIMESQRKDTEALIDANLASFKAVQDLATKQIEVLTHAVKEAEGLDSTDPEEQARIAQAIYAKAAVDIKDMADIASNAQSEVIEIIASRTVQSLKEIQALIKPG